MEPEEKNVILTPELLQEIVELASTTAVESYQKELDKAKREAKREREEARKKNLYNTRILLENYRGFVEHSKKAVYDASQVTEDEDRLSPYRHQLFRLSVHIRLPHGKLPVHVM